jgi:glutamine amidotransferase
MPSRLLKFPKQLPDPDATSFSSEVLRRAMLDTISSLNIFAREAGITQVGARLVEVTHLIEHTQPSLMNFCVTDGETVVATRYISSRKDEAASLVCLVLPGYM